MATTVGPYPKAMQFALHYARLDFVHNWGITLESPAEDSGRLGPLVAETPAGVKNRGAMEMKRKEKTVTDATVGIIEENEGRLITQDLTEAMAKVINEMEAEDNT